MKVYRTDEIRNVVLLGHGGSGKTSLVEAMAYVSGATNRMGKVADKNTISDFDKEEQKRGFSLSTTLTPIEWEKAKINVLDTPGYFDFVGEAEEAAAAADAAVIVVNGKNGVEVGTLKAWALCEKYSLPRMIFITNMDFDNASFRKITEDLTEQFGKKIAPIHFPIRENEKFVGYVNVVKMAAGLKLELEDGAIYAISWRTPSSSGSGSSYTSGQSFTTDLPADSINRVTVNGKKLDSKYYTVSSNGSGSIVTLTDAYLATLKAGTYTIKIESATHVSTGTFTIKADGTPKTADAGIALYAVMAVSSLMGTAVVSKKCRKA